MPAVMKSIFVPLLSKMRRTSSSDEMAASRPLPGSFPAPRPSPNDTLYSTRLLPSACSSVLQAMKSTPSIPRFHM